MLLLVASCWQSGWSFHDHLLGIVCDDHLAQNLACSSECIEVTKASYPPSHEASAGIYNAVKFQTVCLQNR
jgi:hypothetical protein